MEAHQRHFLGRTSRRVGKWPPVFLFVTFFRFLFRSEPTIEPEADIHSGHVLHGLMFWIRVFFIVGVSLRLRLHIENYYLNGWRFQVQIALLGFFFIYSVVFASTQRLWRKATATSILRWIQIVFDMATVSASYYLTQRADSDFFLFYILSILVAAQYGSFREAIVTIFLTAITFFATMSIAYFENPDLYYENWRHVVYRVFLSRLFGLSVVGLACAFYRRLEKEYAELEAQRVGTREQVSTLVRLPEGRDPKIMDYVLQIVLAAVTARDGVRFERAMLFLRDDETGEMQGRCGMGPVDAAQGREMWAQTSVEWSFENIVDIESRRVRYRSERLNQALQRVAISQRTVESVRRELYERSHVISSADRCPALRPVLREFDVRDFAIAPLRLGDDFMGILIADNVVTGKEISRRDWNDLLVYANLAADGIENAIKLSAHIEREVVKALTDSAVALAHEVSSPLDAARCGIELVLERRPDEWSARKLEQVLSDIHRLRYLLYRSRYYGRAFKVGDLIEQSVVSLVEEVLEEPAIADQISSGEIELLESFPEPDQEIMARVDAVLMKSAVRNILQNAIDAVLEGGERKIEVHLTQTFLETQIRVRDYGPGISRKDFPEKDDLSRPYRTTKVLTERSGTGLGLSIAQAAVRAHDGEIRVPDCDVGAEFTIVLKN